MVPTIYKHHKQAHHPSHDIGDQMSQLHTPQSSHLDTIADATPTSTSFPLSWPIPTGVLAKPRYKSLGKILGNW